MEHFGYLQGLLKEGKLILAGPCLDRVMGITIFKADSEEEARAIMNNDPAVVKGVMSAELHPYRVSLLTGRD
ncbi:MAG: YciI family protein, partial [Tumebacillaceae bacterium]